MCQTLSWGITALGGSDAHMVLNFIRFHWFFGRNQPAGSLFYGNSSLIVSNCWNAEKQNKNQRSSNLLGNYQHLFPDSQTHPSLCVQPCDSHVVLTQSIHLFWGKELIAGQNISILGRHQHADHIWSHTTERVMMFLLFLVLETARVILQPLMNQKTGKLLKMLRYACWSQEKLCKQNNTIAVEESIKAELRYQLCEHKPCRLLEELLTCVPQ